MSALRSLLCAVTLAGLPAYPLTATAAALPATASDAVPTPVLNWQPCTSQARQGFDCATAQVPLDYSQPYGQTITLALIRHRATGPGSRLGSIFVNFGGPSAQGVVVLPGTFAANPPYYFPEPLRERFDIISWDPRGDGASTAVHCFPTAQDDENFLAMLPLSVPATPEQQRDVINGLPPLTTNAQRATPPTCFRTCQQPTPRGISTYCAGRWATNN